MRRIILVGALLAALLSPTGDARAASGPGLLPVAAGADTSGDPTADATVAAAEPAAPQPIPLSKVARAADEVQARLRAIAGGLAPSRLELEVAADLPSREHEIVRLKQVLEGVAPEVLSARAINFARSDWARLDMVIRDWEERLEGALSVLQEQQTEVRRLTELWTLTEKEALAQGAPAVVTARISGVRARAAEVDAQFKVRVDALLVLQDRVARCRESVIAGTTAAEEAYRVFQQALFEIESAPLWTAVGSPHPSAAVLPEVDQVWRVAAAEIREYLRKERARTLAQVALLVALAAGIVAIRRRSRDWLNTSDPFAAKAAVVLSRPVSSAALIMILLGMASAAPPTAVRQLLGVLVLVPFFRLLPVIARRRLLPPLHVLGALWVVARFQDLVLPHSLLERLLMLATGITGLVGVAFALRPKSPVRALASTPMRRVLIMGSCVAGAALAVAIVSNVFGNVTLADVLTRGTLVSAFAGVLFYAGAAILDASMSVLLRSPAIHGLRSLRDRADVLQSRWSRAIGVAALFGWAYATLYAFQLWAPAVNAVSTALTARLVVGKIDVSLGNFAAFAAALAIAIVVAKVLRIVLDDAVLPGLDLPRGIPNAISTTLQYVIVAFGVVLAFLAAGIDMTRFGFLAGALGIGIGFGLQNIVSNFVSGLILIYERPVHEGDVIEVGAVRGRVQRIGIRSSTVRTFEGADVVVPNASLLSSDVTNWTLSDQVCRAEITVGVAYSTDPRRVIEILQGVVKGRADILQQPPPMALFTGLGDSSLNFALRFWTPDFDSLLLAKSNVLADTYAALIESGIEIPFPQRDLHIRSVDEAAARSLSGERSATT